jgi:hypothetical protein
VPLACFLCDVSSEDGPSKMSAGALHAPLVAAVLCTDCQFLFVIDAKVTYVATQDITHAGICEHSNLLLQSCVLTVL